MTRKRRIFDIDMPDTADAPQAPAPGAPPRRGPMASAIAENAGALQARAEVQATIRQENDALAHEFIAMRDAGQVVEHIPLDDVHTHLLMRERLDRGDPELVDLVTSLRDIGLSNPIRVEARADGQGYELIQGFRRLTAYRRLLDTEGDAWARIPALVQPRGVDVAGLYRRMVDENVVRKDLSFAEMAHAARNYADDPATAEFDVSGAIAVLFQSAPYSKRSYIKSFARLLEALGDTLAHADAIPRKLGVDLARALDDRADLSARIRDDLCGWDNRSVADELGVLRRYAGLDDDDSAMPTTAKPAQGRAPGRAPSNKTTFDLRTSLGRVKCTAASGRLEIRTDRDFSTMDRDRLERAIAALLDGLT